MFFVARGGGIARGDNGNDGRRNRPPFSWSVAIARGDERRVACNRHHGRFSKSITRRIGQCLNNYWAYKMPAHFCKFIKRQQGDTRTSAATMPPSLARKASPPFIGFPPA